MTRPAVFLSCPGAASRGFALLAALLLTACTGREDHAAPIPLAASQAEPVEVDGARFQALAFENGPQAATAFGFDVRAAGLLPLRVSIDNRGGGLRVVPRQTFLVDRDGQAWPLLTSGQASERLGRAGIQPQGVPRVPVAKGLDVLTGFALDMLVGPAFASDAEASARPETPAGAAFAEKNQRNPSVRSGQAASGVLFFPGQEEAHGARALRLCYEQDGRLKFLTLPLKPFPPP